jgi:beta-hydroxylase
LSPGHVILALFVASVIYIHFRGKVRLGFSRQISDHSTFMAPINCFLYLFSAVPNKPFLEVDLFPELKVLRDNWQTIRDEAVQLYEAGHIKGSERYDDAAFNSFIKKGWKRFYVKWYEDTLPSAHTLCPKTVALLASVPSVHGAMFAVLPVGGTLVRHRDPFAGSLRYHLGLVTPNEDRCRIYIDGTPYSWRDGEDIVFDETYIHHAHNETDMDRIILFCDVERPMRVGFARAFNRWFGRHLLTFTVARNAEGDRVGGLNRVFPYIYAVRLKIKALKRANRRFYYLCKYVFYGGLIALFFI